MKNIIIAAVVVGLLILGGVALANRNNANDNATVNDSTSVTPTLSGSANDEMEEESTMSPSPSGSEAEQSGGTGNADSQTATVNYGTGGFEQSTVTVKSGSKITITNSSDGDAQPASDPHPQHTDNPELNFGTLAAGESKTVTVTKTGTWGMHDHFDASKKMTVIVQ